ncbi:uncharacterized protein LACBIDRAFT_333115 [Laccaria bicolor S238N-H82]|uniref:Predicted protein n=1 Tax=Laccaria bicolor (strain S238N-H82 / ATCC MYA-4686) TaxID=486041 RepID=B0DUX9_LACBS|nr:uncharacterized protein LACBIDRAFT_333115 [Laccaria bicolor S238N-H82]EDR01625.1 predicted protein [Laccaria bicolor S238N-H82]|eukprot:XP_001887701.1 predicted protein [Laccaria bicolor S238N-H82]
MYATNMPPPFSPPLNGYIYDWFSNRRASTESLSILIWNISTTARPKVLSDTPIQANSQVTVVKPPPLRLPLPTQYLDESWKLRFLGRSLKEHINNASLTPPSRFLLGGHHSMTAFSLASLISLLYHANMSHLYEYLLNLDLEVEHIWSSRWNTIKVLYLLTRYMPFLNIISVLYYILLDGSSEEACRTTFQVNGFTESKTTSATSPNHQINHSLCKVLLTMRTSADIDCDQGTSGAENDHILTSETRKCGVPERTDLLFLPLRFVPLPFVYMVKSYVPPHLQPPVYTKLISLSMPTTTFSQRNLFSISILSSAYLTSILTGSNERCTLS